MKRYGVSLGLLAMTLVGFSVTVPAWAAEEDAAAAAVATASEDDVTVEGATTDSAPVRSSARRKASYDEITVTARKTEESLKDVPLSITAFDSGMIQAAGIKNLQDVADLTPGLTFFNPFGENLPVPIIRGVAQTDIFGETNAAIFVDGIYVAGREGLNFSQLDVERIEVVKGPQSAQYGRTAFAGAINYITKRPAHEFESKVILNQGNDNRQSASLMLSGPLLGDKLRGRVAGLYDKWDGSYRNTDHPETGIGGRVFRTFQASLVWEPTDTLEVYGSIYTSNDEIDDAPVYGILANCENVPVDPANPTDPPFPSGVRLQNFCGEIPTLQNAASPGPGLVSKDSMPKIERALGEDRDLFRANLRIDWDVSFGTFTSLTGYTSTVQQSLSDFGHLGDHTPFLYCNAATPLFSNFPSPCTGPANQRFFTGILNENTKQKTTEISQEIRFASPRENRFRYQLGAYGYSSNFDGRNGGDGGIIASLPHPGGNIALPPMAAPATIAIGNAIFYCTFTDDGCRDPLQRQFTKTEVDSWSVFGDMDFDFTDRLEGRFELRYSEQTEKATDFYYALCKPFPGGNPACGDDWYDLRVVDPVPHDPANPDASTNSGSADFSAVTGRLGLNYRLNDEWMVYGSVANGTKPGGIQIRTPNVITGGGSVPQLVVHTFDPENIISYELGLKGATSDGRVSVDTALFFLDWTDIVLRQLTEESPSGQKFEQPQAFNVNAGSAEVWGFEMTANIAFTDNLNGRFTVNWNDAQLVDAAQDTFEKFPTFAPDGDVSGNKLLRQPEWTSSVSLDYQRPVWRDWDGFARVDTNYQDKIFLGNDNQSWVPPRFVTNLNFGVESDRVTLNFWVRNLFNDDKPVAAFRDIFWSNTDNIFPPFVDPGPLPNPGFDKFPPLRYTATYPALRTMGVTLQVRFGGLAR